MHGDPKLPHHDTRGLERKIHQIPPRGGKTSIQLDLCRICHFHGIIFQHKLISKEC